MSNVRSYHHEVSAAIGGVAAKVRLVKSDKVSQGAQYEVQQQYMEDCEQLRDGAGEGMHGVSAVGRAVGRELVRERVATLG